MKILRRLLPVILITSIVFLISLVLYQEVMNLEEARCWKALDTTARSISREMKTKFEDEITKLKLLEMVVLEEESFTIDDVHKLHLNLLQNQKSTIFLRMDVLFPDNRFFTNGTVRIIEDDIDFAYIMQKGEHMTLRKTDPITGKECVFYVLPITEQEELLAVLIGVIDAKTLQSIFQPEIFQKEANITLIDARDGSYIMDSWHDELINIYEMGDRQKLKGYENVDWIQEMKDLQTGNIAFISRTTGAPMYMYYTPIGIFDWQLSIHSTEEALFQDLIDMRKLFIVAGIMEVFLLIAYFFWNIQTVRQLEKSNAEIHLQKENLKQISYRDFLTSLYNRNKYTELLEHCNRQTLQNVGIAYIDLNGLKEINDTQSHEAGDAYLRNAAITMKSVFAEQCYRIGGDEFVILSIGTEEAFFTEQIALLKERMQANDIQAAIGFFWTQTCKNLEECIKTTETRMYQDKEAYYVTHERWRTVSVNTETPSIKVGVPCMETKQ